MLKKLCFVIVLVLFTNTAIIAQVIKWNGENQKIIKTPQWVVNDVVYKTNQKIENPFEKEAFALVDSEGSQQKIPLFYNGVGEWVFRYSGSAIGKKQFSITSEISELNGQNGAIVVTKNKKKDRKGGIVLHKDNPQRFFYEDGSHYFNLAFECDWLFALDYGNQDLSKTNQLLNTVVDNGFNQLVMNVYSHDVKWEKDPLLKEYPQHEYGGREDIFPFLGSNSKPDFSSLNTDFFKHFDKVISVMHEKEIISHLMIYVWNKKVSWPDMDTLEDNRYYDYVVKRYQAFPNIIWDVSKEALFYGRATKEYISERIQRARNLDAYNRLVSVHDYGFCSKHSDEVDFISMQNWAHTLYQKMTDARTKFPNKPIFNIEHGGYEESPYVVFPGAYTNAEACLRRNYMCLFAGGYTTYYWQGASWNVLIHNPYDLPDSFKKPHFEYFKYMKGLFEKVNFENFEANPQYNSTGYGLLNKKDGELLLYVPKENNWTGVSWSLNKQYDFENATQQWFNTITGEYTKEEKFDTKRFQFWKNRPWHLEQDAIFIVKGLTKKEKEEKK